MKGNKRTPNEPVEQDGKKAVLGVEAVEDASTTEELAETAVILAETVETLAENQETLAERVEELEDTVEQKDERIAELEQNVEKQEERVNTVNKNAVLGRKDLRQRIIELQERELLKDAHIREENLDEDDLGDDHAERLGKVTKENEGTFWYLGAEAGRDPVKENEDARSSTRIDTADLLPVQQLASMDDDALEQHTNTKPDYWAVKAWKDRDEDKLGLWSRGSKGVREYMNSSELASAIKVKTSLSKSSAQEYARRAFDRLAHLTHQRVRIENKSRRKDGLKYREKRLVIDADAEIPGEPRAAAGAEAALGGPATDAVGGD